MEDTHFLEQDNSYAATLSLADLGTKLFEDCLDVLPLDICAGRVSEDDIERALVLPSHPRNGTTKGYQDKERAFG